MRLLAGVLCMSMFTGMASAQIDYEISKTNLSMVDSSRGLRSINVVVFYPSDVAGSNKPVAAPANKKFPLIVFGHGEGTPVHYYTYLKDFYVPRGFMMAFPKSEMGNNMDAMDFAKDMVFVINEFEKMKADPASMFYGRYNNKACLSGHGSGGGAAFLAAEMKPSVAALFTLAAAETSPSAIAAAQNISVPALVFSGGKDCIVPASGNQEDLFNSLASPCKVYINQLEATHCQFAMDNNKCTKDEKNCTASGYTSDSTNLYSNMLSVSFLRYYMKYNALAWPLFIDKMTTLADIVYVNNCFVPSAPRMAGEAVTEDGYIYRMKIYPNPVAPNSKLTIDVGSFEKVESNIAIYNTMGQKLFDQTVILDADNNTIDLPTDGLAPGHYMLSITDGNSQRITKPLLIQ